ncbi:TonB-dependent receptor [Oleiagrimonas sp. C23AA]|uniref:TonB-dependent receptor n=1 Tax=Oleiagrimonas sp. C23AA TaxID=2719047 RepID=UPI00141FE7E5|nr:TonB-dependent receptor [Oleiagrimonas sp. C23AA]NII10783.1 TonB-dependent receptor [Oleiagrimonas sp. C23AA]
MSPHTHAMRSALAVALAGALCGAAHANTRAHPAPTDADSAVSSATALATGSPADDNKTKGTTELETVQVSGRAVGFTNTAVPVQITKFQPPLSSVTDAVNFAPGVNITQGGVFDSDDYSTGITLRGFTQDTLGFTIDGLPNGSAGYGGGAKPNRFLDSENLAEATVSQGTADIGSPSAQALGGTLSYVSSDPRNDAGLRVDQSIGEWNAKRTFVRYDTGALFNNSTYAYLSYSTTHNNRWVHHGHPDNGHTSRDHIDAKLISYLTDKLTLTARGSWDDAYENNYNDVTKAQFHDDPRDDHLTVDWTGIPQIDQNYVNPWNTKRKNALVGIKLDYQVNDQANVSFYPYYHFQEGYGGWMPPYQLYATDAGGNLVNHYPAEGADFVEAYYRTPDGLALAQPKGCKDPFDASCYPTGSSAINSFRQSIYKNARYGFLLNGHWNIGINHLYAGVWLEDQHRIAGRKWHAVLDTSASWQYADKPYYIQFYDRLITHTRKLFLQDTLNLGSIDLSLGVDKYLVHINGTDEIADSPFASKNFNSKLLPSVGAVWHLDTHHQIYASYTKNFAPPADSLLQAGDSGSDISHVKPETSANIDLGYRYQSRQLQASLALYHVRFANQINEITPSSDYTRINYTVGTEGTYINVGGIESKGVEGLLNWSVAPVLDVYTSLTWNQSKYLESINDIVKGNKVAGQPGRMLAVGVNYHRHGLRAGVSAKYVGDRYGTLDNSEKMNPYTVFDAHLGYHLDLTHGGASRPLLKSLDFDLTVTNIANKHYLATLGDDSTPGYYYIGAPRTAVFTVSAQF